jgi:hypothetical protein
MLHGSVEVQSPNREREYLHQVLMPKALISSAQAWLAGRIGGFKP